MSIKQLLATIDENIDLIPTLQVEQRQIEKTLHSLRQWKAAHATQQLQELADLRAEIEVLKNRPAATIRSNGLPRYHFELDPANPDASWEQIIREGQAIQRPFHIEGERYWQNKQGDSPSGRGWYGTVSMPIITIVCTAPEYNFRSTKRLPGRFRLTTPARWGSTLRFHSDVGPTIHDNWRHENGLSYGFATNAPIGIYVEPTTDVDAEFRVRPFEQSIENCLIVAHNGTLPIYLAQNQDRFWIRDCNIQQHQGAQVGIKHGPPIATSLKDQPDWGNCYLADPRFMDLQMEGPHNAKRPQAAIFATGSNIHMRGINLYGWMQGPYLHGGENRYVQVQVNTSETDDGRTPLPIDQVCGATLNKFQPVVEYVSSHGAPATTYVNSATRHEQPDLGTHKQGDSIYGG